MKLLVINGPNINMLGIREPEIYGRTTYADLVKYIEEVCAREGIEVRCVQSNHEGTIVDYIQDAYQKVDDALKAVALPAVEVHLSNIYDREEFRHHSYPGMACMKTIYGHGIHGYEEAILFLKETLAK